MSVYVHVCVRLCVRVRVRVRVRMHQCILESLWGRMFICAYLYGMFMHVLSMVSLCLCVWSVYTAVRGSEGEGGIGRLIVMALLHRARSGMVRYRFPPYAALASVWAASGIRTWPCVGFSNPRG